MPIPLNIYKKIVVFPTHGHKQPECKWIFTNNVHEIKRHPDNRKASIIIFKNGMKLPLDDVSYYVAKSQYEKSLIFINGTGDLLSI